MGIIIPKRLFKGATLGIISPASPADSVDTEKSIKFIENLGYKIKRAKNLNSENGYLAGNDNERALDINNMFADKAVDGIICIRGGYGSIRILDKINYSLIKKNPKVFIGYSDITAIHTAINSRTGLVSFHGPMLASDMRKGLDRYSLDCLQAMVEKKQKNIHIKNPSDSTIKALSHGKATGRLVGGNLAVIASTIGTEYEIDTKDKILFLEDIGEEPYKIDRMLMQLKLAKKFDDSVAIVLCNWNKCECDNNAPTLTLSEVFEQILLPLKKPILCGYYIGHCSPNITIPIGAKACIDTYKKHFEIIEPVVS